MVAGDTQADASVNFGVSINDLRKNLRDLNEHMDRECHSSAARYGMVLDASLITGIDPPPEVESALAAINTAHNQVSSDISLAQAAADQKIVQSWRTSEFGENDEDSILTILLQETDNGGTQLTMIHSNIPEGQTQYEKGWVNHYFEPMKGYFG